MKDYPNLIPVPEVMADFDPIAYMISAIFVVASIYIVLKGVRKPSGDK